MVGLCPRYAGADNMTDFQNQETVIIPIQNDDGDRNATKYYFKAQVRFIPLTLEARKCGIIRIIIVN
jgi:hypothetical protein